MTLATAVALAAIFSAILGVPALIYTAKAQRRALDAAARQAEKDRRDEIADAIQAAVDPIMRDVVYWRARAQAFEFELLRMRNET